MKAPIALPFPARPAPSPAIEARSVDAMEVQRFDVHQRIQHVLMLTSFTVLALTGLPQKFDQLGVSQGFIALLGGLDVVRSIHHIAAWVMLFDCAYHAAYLAWSLRAGRARGGLGMIPTLQDFRDVGWSLLYLLGLTKRRPQYDRFTYLEKFDYWAVFWGIAIIGGSGLALLFPVAVTSILPGTVVPIAFVAHSDEAVLAVGWILVVHMFYAHLSPKVFPFNSSIFTGKVKLGEARRDHPKWIARLTEDASKDE